MITRAPCSANCSAMARPMPCAAPVMSTILLSKFTSSPMDWRRNPVRGASATWGFAGRSIRESQVADAPRTAPLTNHTHPMRFAVADKHRTIAVNKHAVRTRHFACERIAIRSVAFLSCSRDEFNRHPAHVNHPDRMAFGVGQIDVAIRRDADAFRARERGEFRRAAIAGESFLARACDVMDRPSFHIQPIN